MYLSVIEDESKETIYCMTPTWKLTMTHEISHWDMMVAFFCWKTSILQSIFVYHCMGGVHENYLISGNVVTIKLAENQENVLQQDGTYLTMQIETHFQMNYSTGEWNRIRKYRRLEDTAAQ